MKYKVIIMSIIASGVLGAASIDHLSNNSASYFQNPSQVGKVTVEGVFYNPAGTVFLEDGTYVNANLQNSLIEESMTLNGKKMASKTYSGAPSFNIVHKKGDYSAFVNVSVIAGGATLKYKDGVAGVQLAADAFNGLVKTKSEGNLDLNAKLTENHFKGENRYYQTLVGGAYKVNNNLSVSGGLRYVVATRKLEGTAKYDYTTAIGSKFGLLGSELSIDSERKADGFGATLGLNYKPTDTVNVALRYDTPVKLKFKTKASEVKGLSIGTNPVGISFFYPEYADGVEYRRDLPGILALGVSKDVNKTTYSVGYTRYFNKSAELDRFNYKNGYEYNFGIDHKLNDKFTVHAGYNYAKTGASKETFSDVEYAINSKVFSTGVTYKQNEKSEWKFGIAHVNYKKENGVKETKAINPLIKIDLDKSKVEYDKAINVFSLGYTYKF